MKELRVSLIKKTLREKLGHSISSGGGGDNRPLELLVSSNIFCQHVNASPSTVS